MRARSAKGAQTKLQIIRAAADLFHQQGVRATSPDEVIQASGTGKGQFYHYFKNKEGLVHEVLQAHLEEIKAGTFWVNDPLTDNEAGPFGGMRQSGIGRELGVEGLEAFREPKHVHIDYIQERKSYWFPYADRTW